MAHRGRHLRSALLVVPLALAGALLAPTGPAHAVSGDYVVVLKPGVSVQAHLKA